MDARLAARPAEPRAGRGWSLGEPAERSGVSRSTPSRAERAETSPTIAVLNRLCAVYGRTMSRLLSEVEAEPVLLVRAAEQPVWEGRHPPPSGHRDRQPRGAPLPVRGMDPGRNDPRLRRRPGRGTAADDAVLQAGRHAGGRVRRHRVTVSQWQSHDHRNPLRVSMSVAEPRPPEPATSINVSGGG
ncbi:helix-turn-helix domain-containing protein [Streptomyces sp. NPDC048392]|uniref:helix-turn-helix domain-containing protein n=1 Tax=Streptomyces sp. NPDC048392 TaxID=3365543 RepID=UPI0037126936